MNRDLCSSKVEPCTSVEQPGWLLLRQALWPHCSRAEHVEEMASFLARPERYCQYVAYADDGAPAGLVEGSLRSEYVNGTATCPVAFLEGLYVEPQCRRRGIARLLVDAVQRWARARGCTELASDALLANERSHAVHQALGFLETERVVYFRKALARE